MPLGNLRGSQPPSDGNSFRRHYLQRRLVVPLVIEAHQGFCGIAGFWDRGRIIASAGKAQPFQGWGHHQRSGWEVRFWDSLTGRPVSSGLPLARDSGIRICHVDDEMTRLVEAGLDGVITLRKLKTNETQTISSEPEKHLLGARFSLDGRLMVAEYQPTQPGVESELQEIKMWDLMKGDLVFTGNRAATPFPLSGQFTPDNKRLLYLDSGVIRAIDVATSIEQFTIPVENCEGFVIHPSGRELAALVNPSMVVFDLSTCEERLRWNVGGPAISATYRSDGRQLAVGTALGEITLWEADTGSQIDKMQGHSGPVTSLNFHPDDSRLVSGGFDGTVRLWDLKRNRDTVKVQSEQGARDWPRLYADADLLLTGFPSNEFDNTLAPPQKFIEQWNPNTGEPVRVRCQTDFPIRNACASRDGKRLYLGDGESHVTVVDALDGSQLQTWQIGSGQTSASAISDDGRWYCWSAEDCVTHVVDAMTGQEVGMLEDSEYLIQRLAFDRAGDRLAIFDNGGRLRLWDRKRLELERTIQLPNVGVHCLAFDRSGQYVAVAGGERGATIGVVYLVRCTGNSPPTPLFGHGTSFVLVAEFSPDGRRLATGGADGTVRLWDVATAQELLVLKGHSAMVTSLRFADGGKRLVSVDTNAEVRHWDARPL